MLTLSDLKDHVGRIVRDKGLTRLPEPVQLRSGAMSQDFVDAKAALAEGDDLERACRAMLEVASDMGAEFDAVGGMTLGADQFSHVMAVLDGKRWFVVRKATKGRGTDKRVEGAALGEGVRVLLVEDVVTLGGSVREAYEIVRQTGATVAGVVCLVDRSDAAGPYFAADKVPYQAVLTYRDLGIDPVREGLVRS